MPPKIWLYMVLYYKGSLRPGMATIICCQVLASNEKGDLSYERLPNRAWDIIACQLSALWKFSISYGRPVILMDGTAAKHHRIKGKVLFRQVVCLHINGHHHWGPRWPPVPRNSWVPNASNHIQAVAVVLSGSEPPLGIHGTVAIMKCQHVYHASFSSASSHQSWNIANPSMQGNKT